MMQRASYPSPLTYWASSSSLQQLAFPGAGTQKSAVLHLRESVVRWETGMEAHLVLMPGESHTVAGAVVGGGAQ